MSTFLKTAAMLLLTALCTPTKAQTISPADQQGIEACFNSFKAVFETLDVSTVPSLLTETAEQIIPSGEIFRGRDNIVASMAGYFAYLKSQPKPDHVDQKITGLQSRYLSPDVILSTYTEETTMTFAGKTKVEKLTNSIVLRKVKGTWLVDLIALTPVVGMPKQ